MDVTIFSKRKGAIGCTFTYKGKSDIFLIREDKNTIDAELWRHIYEGNRERFDHYAAAGDLFLPDLPEQKAPARRKTKAK